MMVHGRLLLGLDGQVSSAAERAAAGMAGSEAADYLADQLNVQGQVLVDTGAFVIDYAAQVRETKPCVRSAGPLAPSTHPHMQLDPCTQGFSAPCGLVAMALLPGHQCQPSLLCA
jgi:hypothetical protein